MKELDWLYLFDMSATPKLVMPKEMPLVISMVGVWCVKG